MNHFNLITRSTIVGLVALSAGCATLNKDECLVADWAIIGMEDGANGMQQTHLAEHRKACAKHGVQPDLAAYQSGHAQGARRYCTPSNGFEMGRAGQADEYRRFCPADVAAGFMRALDAGTQVQGADRALLEAKLAVEGKRNERNQISDRISTYEAELYADGTSSTRRREIGEIMAPLRESEAARAAELTQLKLVADEREREVNALVARLGYAP